MFGMWIRCSYNLNAGDKLDDDCFPDWMRIVDSFETGDNLLFRATNVFVDLLSLYGSTIISLMEPLTHISILHEKDRNGKENQTLRTWSNM